MPLPNSSILSRRRFLYSASAVSIVSSLSRNLGAQASSPNGAAHDRTPDESIPYDTLLKFNEDGTPKRFAGNTVICHLPEQSPVRDATVSLGKALRAASFAHKLGVLPNDSYHATILGGANDQDRKRYGWPADVPLDAPMNECNRIVSERMLKFTMQEPLPLRFRVNAEKTLAAPKACGIHLLPFDSNEQIKLRKLRDRLSDEVFRYRASDHDAFGFHISLAYQLRTFSSAENTEYRATLGRHMCTFSSSVPSLELGIPEFCTFTDMYRFEVRTLLKT